MLPPPQELMANILASLETSVSAESTVTNVSGDAYRRVDVGISGRLEGCTVKEGPGDTAFTDAPDIWFPQAYLGEDPPVLPVRPTSYGRLYRGIGTFRAADGSGMTILHPAERSAWNGKLFIVQHGSGIYTPMRELVPRDPEASFNPHLSRNYYAELMIDKGYAVAWVRKDASRTGGVSIAELEDGTRVTRTFTNHATLELALTRFAQRFIGERLGEKPARTYFYGFSGGGITGRLMNYAPDANVDVDGSRIVDGFLQDDAGGGRPLPVRFRGVEEVLFATERDREHFAPQIDVSHGLYYVDSYLALKRENARLLLEKGLGAKHRLYEVRGVSHFGAGSGRPESLDLGGLMEALIDALDQWVDGGIVPPSSRADVRGLADQPGIALPEIACPLGVHYAFPEGEPNERRAAQTTTFAEFDGVSLEPLDARGVLVDMNGNAVRDTRETVEAAWRRLGLLQSGEAFTAERYVACVEEAAAALADQRLLPGRVADHYVQQASQ